MGPLLISIKCFCGDQLSNHSVFIEGLLSGSQFIGYMDTPWQLSLIEVSSFQNKNRIK